MKKYTIFLFICVVSFTLVYWFWPQNGKLPILDKVYNFQLNDVHGGDYQLENEKVKLIAFYYTHCPDICPLTMVDFKDLQEELKKQGLFGDKVELVTITFDPENDTDQVVRKYASAFQADPFGWKWLRGTPAETRAIGNQLNIQFLEFENGLFTHSTTMYLIDEDNKIRALYNMSYAKKPIEKEQILADIRLLVDGS